MPPDGIAEGNDGNSPVDSNADFGGFEYPTAKAAQEEGSSPETQQKEQENRDSQIRHETRQARLKLEETGQNTQLEVSGGQFAGLSPTELVKGMFREKDALRQRAAAGFANRLIYGKMLGDLSAPYITKAAEQASDGQPMRDAIAAETQKIQKALRAVELRGNFPKFVQETAAEFAPGRYDIPKELFPLMNQIDFVRQLLMNQGVEPYGDYSRQLNQYFEGAEAMGTTPKDMIDVYNKTVVTMGAARQIVEGQLGKMPDGYSPLSLKLPKVPWLSERTYMIEANQDVAGMVMYSQHGNRDYPGYLLYAPMNPGEQGMEPHLVKQYVESQNKDAHSYLDKQLVPVVEGVKQIGGAQQLLEGEPEFQKEGGALDTFGRFGYSRESYANIPQVRESQQRGQRIVQTLRGINPDSLKSDTGDHFLQEIDGWHGMKEGFLGMGKGKKAARRSEIETQLAEYVGRPVDISDRNQVAEALKWAAVREVVKQAVSGVGDHRGNADTYFSTHTEPAYNPDQPGPVQTLKIPTPQGSYLSESIITPEQMVVNVVQGNTQEAYNFMAALAAQEDAVRLPVAQELDQMARVRFPHLGESIRHEHQLVGSFMDTQMVLVKLLKGVLAPALTKKVDSLDPDSLTPKGLDALNPEIQHVIQQQADSVKRQLATRKAS